MDPREAVLEYSRDAHRGKCLETIEMRARKCLNIVELHAHSAGIQHSGHTTFLAVQRAEIQQEI